MFEINRWRNGGRIDECAGGEMIEWMNTFNGNRRGGTTYMQIGGQIIRWVDW